MARIDSIFAIVLQQGANELRALPIPHRSSWPRDRKRSARPTSEDMLRELLRNTYPRSAKPRFVVAEESTAYLQHAHEHCADTAVINWQEWRAFELATSRRLPRRERLRMATAAREAQR